MPLSLFNKLQKLKINVYGNRRRIGLPKGTFTVMFNPTSISTQHENKFSKLQGINTRGRVAKYAYSRSNAVKLDLILDGTGVTDFDISTLLGWGTDSVSDQIKKFLNLCFHMDGSIHEPKFLKIQWGSGILSDFDCRLQSVETEYSLFDKDGTPLHAVLKTVFIEDADPSKQNRLAGKNSPDLSHTRIVKSGDTLPLLSKEIYGSAQYYLRIAQINNIDDFRNLKPGQEIIFPPLDSSEMI
jgi:LysM repeat protein